jgi:adhesin transport system outer membrane protein
MFVGALALRRSARALAASLLALGAHLGAADGVRADTLHSVVRHTLETNPELQALRFNRQAIDHELRAAQGLHLPSVDVTANHGRDWNRNKTQLGIETTNNWHTRREFSGILSQRVFDGFEARYEVDRQKNRVESARWRVADTANSIALRAVQSYLEMQRALAVQAAARANLAALQGLSARVRARVAAGRANAGEESEAGARVENGKALLAEAQVRVRDAEALFRSIVGRPPSELAPVQAPRKLVPPTVDVAVGEAVRFAPSVIATQYDTSAAEAAVGSARAKLFPRLNLKLSVDHGRGVEQLGDRESEMQAMFVVRWNLFNGGIDKARINEASARALEAAEISANTQRVIEREVRVSWNAVTGADQRVPALSRQLALNRATRSIYGQQFDAGQRRLLDLLDIQNETFVTEASLKTEELVGRYNTFRILAAMGRLVEALGLDPPGEAAVPAPATLLGTWHTETRPVSEK